MRSRSRIKDILCVFVTKKTTTKNKDDKHIDRIPSRSRVLDRRGSRSNNTCRPYISVLIEALSSLSYIFIMCKAY